jgi:hypothetical protein
MMEYEQDPWGEARNDWRSAMIASTVANRHRNPKREPLYKPGDFVPQYGEQGRRRQTPTQIKHVFQLITSTVNQQQKAS